jgi:hypothetical protein
LATVKDQLGTTPEQRENYLRTIATAWNIAILDKGIHEKCIADSIDKFKQANKGDETHTDAYEENLRKLIDRKLSLFPSVKVQIINVRIFLEGGQEKISAVSMRM